GALAGLANPPVQEVIRDSEYSPKEEVTLTAAIRSGALSKPEAKSKLALARAHAQRAHALAPQDPKTLKALGFVHSALQDYDQAIHFYQQAVLLDRDAWDSLINWAELESLSGNHDDAVLRFSQAYSAMERRYSDEPQRVGPWQADLAVAIGDLQHEQGQLPEALEWFKKARALEPYHPEATQRILETLETLGDQEEINRLCAQLRLSTVQRSIAARCDRHP
ncbi:MAG: tetratricopeptide repeat protein, partial [Myxococcota bacterium]